jgi:hypothetical protein
MERTVVGGRRSCSGVTTSDSEGKENFVPPKNFVICIFSQFGANAEIFFSVSVQFKQVILKNFSSPDCILWNNNLFSFFTLSIKNL